jgi:anti-sigma factor RsiW
MFDHDAELVALIDNELDEGRRTALLARLAADDGLCQRYEEFRQASVPLAACFGALLEQAHSLVYGRRSPLASPFAGR